MRIKKNIIAETNTSKTWRNLNTINGKRKAEAKYSNQLKRKQNIQMNYLLISIEEH